MKKYVWLTIASFIAALLNLGVSFIGSLNFVWVITAALLVSGLEDLAIVFALVSGFLFDIFLHADLGTTSISVLIPAGIFIIIRSFGFGDRLWQKFIMIFVVLFLSFFISSLLDIVLRGESISISNNVGYWVSRALSSGIFAVVIHGIIMFWKEKNPSKSYVKL